VSEVVRPEAEAGIEIVRHLLCRLNIPVATVEELISSRRKHALYECMTARNLKPSELKMVLLSQTCPVMLNSLIIRDNFFS